MKNKNIELEKYKYSLLMEVIKELPEETRVKLVEKYLGLVEREEMKVKKTKRRRITPSLKNKEKIIEILKRNKKGVRGKDIYRKLDTHYTTFYNLVNELIKEKKVKKVREGKGVLYFLAGNSKRGRKIGRR